MAQSISIGEKGTLEVSGHVGSSTGREAFCKFDDDQKVVASLDQTLLSAAVKIAPSISIIQR